MGRVANWLWGGDPTSAAATTAELVVIPSGSDVAQVQALSPAVAEAFGINLSSERVDRSQAMSIPAVRQGRQVIAGTLGTVPLIAVRNRAGLPPERITIPLLLQPDPNCTRANTITNTIDDLIFYGWSVWRITERNFARFPQKAQHVNQSRILIDTSTGTIRIDNQVVNITDLIIFTGPDEGILQHGGRALKTCLLLEEAVRNYARVDVPLGMIEDEDGAMNVTEVQTFLDSWEAARRKRSTGYLPKGLRYKNPTFSPEQIQLAGARGFQSQEVGRLMNLPPTYINAPTNDSLTYSTTESNRRQLVDLTFAPFIAAIEQRLSMPDVTPLGTVVSFDLGKFLRGDLTTVLTAAKVAMDSKLMTADEVRVDWLNMPPLTEQQRTELGLPASGSPAPQDKEQSDG